MAATLVAFGPLLAYFSGLLWLLPVAGGYAVGIAVVLLFRWRQWPPWALAPTTLLTMLVYELYALNLSHTTYGLPGPDALRALSDGVISGWAHMLTTALPADVAGDLLALPVMLAVAAGAVSTLLVVGTRSVTPVAAAPLTILVIALLLTAPRPRRGLLVSAVEVTVLVVLLLLRTNRLSATQDGLTAGATDLIGIDLAAQRRTSTVGRVAVGLPGAAVVIALAAAGTAYLPIADGEHRADPRQLYQPEVTLTATLSPLVEVKPQLKTSPPVELFRVTVPREDAELVKGRIRIAALDSFDGALWTQHGTFVRAGQQLPQPLPQPRGHAQSPRVVRLDVEVLSMRTPLLPVVGTPVAARGASTAVDVDSGSLIALARLPSGVSSAAARASGASAAPLHYRLTATVVPLDKGTTTAAPASTAARYGGLPDPPPWVGNAASELAKGRTTTWTQLAAIERRLWDGRYSLDARPGHSYGAVARTLGLGGDKEAYGYAEQNASAFAILARSLGYSTRVAVGYLLSDAGRKGDTYTVTTADADAWPEVELEGYGWVPFEVTNRKNDVGPPPVQSDQIPPLDPQPNPPKEAERDPRSLTQGDEGTPLLTRTARVGLFVLAGVAGLLALAVGASVLTKVLRRRRRRSLGSAARRISAAWQEATDRLREAGQPVPSWQTPAETVQAVRMRTPPQPDLLAAHESLTELAVIATAAVCSPEAPTSVAARRAWFLLDQVSKALAAGQGWAARARALIDPRPLLPDASRLKRVPTGGSSRPEAVPPSRDVAAGSRSGG